MFYNRDMKQNWLSFLVLVAVIGAAYFIVQSVRESAQAAAEAASGPFDQVRQANESLQTQVADLMNPTPTIIPDPVTYINEVRALARLETIQYSVEKVITAEIGQGTFDFLFGDRLLFVAHGVVIAGIDMEKLGPEHLRLENGVLYVTLPPAEIFIATLDNQKSYVYDRDTGFLSEPGGTRPGNPGSPNRRRRNPQGCAGRWHPETGTDKRGELSLPLFPGSGI